MAIHAGAAPFWRERASISSQIIKAAVTYTSAHAAFEGGFRADHTDNLVMAGGAFGSKHINRRDRALNRLTRLMKRTDDVRSVELRSLASVAIVMMDQDGGSDGLSIEGFERRFLKSLFQLIERHCAGGPVQPQEGGVA